MATTIPELDAHALASGEKTSRTLLARALTGLRDAVAIALEEGPIYAGGELLLVSPDHPRAADDSDPDTPFATIQGALTAIGDPVDAADQKRRFGILIQPGEYDEAPSVPAGRRITLIPLGPVTLGDGAGADYASTTPRDLTVDVSAAFGGRSTFTIGTIIPDCIYGDRCTQATGFDISGDLVLTGTPTTPLAAAIRLAMVRIRGDFDASALPAATLDVHNNAVRTDGNVSMATQGVLVNSVRSYYQGTISAIAIVHANSARFDGDITVTSAPTVAGLNIMPPGFHTCLFEGTTPTITAPAGAVYLDAVSNYWFKTNSWALGGSASKTIIGDLVA